MKRKNLHLKRKAIKEKIAEYSIEANYYYIEKYLDKTDKYEYLKNPYGPENRTLKKCMYSLIKTSKFLNSLFPNERNFIQEIYTDFWDIYEEILEEQSLINASPNYNPVRVNLFCLFQSLKKQLFNKKYLLKYLVFTDTRLKELRGKIIDVKKNSLNLFIVIYLLHYRKLSSEYLKNKDFIDELESYLDKNGIKENDLKEKSFNLISKHISSALHLLISIKREKVKSINNTILTLFNNLHQLYALFLSHDKRNRASSLNYSLEGVIQTYSKILKYKKDKKIESIIEPLSILISELEISLNYINRMRRNIISIYSKLNY